VSDFRSDLYRTFQRLMAGGLQPTLALGALALLLEGCRRAEDEEAAAAILELMDILDGGASTHAVARFREA
jgi:hypothetical protein